METNVVLLNGSLTSSQGQVIVERLAELAKKNKDDIYFYICSPGGSLNYCYAIIEMMNRIDNDVNTIILGEASSAAATIAASGTHGKRFVGANANVMFHMPRGTFLLERADVSYAEVMKEHQIDIISEASGRNRDEVGEATTLELFLSAQAVVDFGTADHIL